MGKRIVFIDILLFFSTYHFLLILKTKKQS